jgi:transaldolase
MDPLKSLIASGTKLWLDSIDPQLVTQHRDLGGTGATSNPIIIADLVKTGRFDDLILKHAEKGLSDEAIAWALTDQLVADAQKAFLDVWERTGGDDGYVSFELDPLLEDPKLGPPHGERVRRYVELGRRWSAGHRNRMIKVPATPAGIDALEDLAASGITLNVTLIFSPAQYRAARDAVWRGARRRPTLEGFKSVYSIFVSRVDTLTAKSDPWLGAAQGQIGIVNARAIWRENLAFWATKGLKLKQEIIFASTGTKDPKESPDRYVEALAGSDIQTNPPATNAAAGKSGKTYRRTLDLAPAGPVADAYARLDVERVGAALVDEGVVKFADPHKALIALIGQKRSALATA